MAYLDVNYNGFTSKYDSETDTEIQLDPQDPDYFKYNFVSIEHNGGKEIFDSGDFVKDWFMAKRFYMMNLNEKEHLSGSSSCDHFHMDGADFDSAYLHMEGDVPVLKYLDKTDPNWIRTQWHIVKDGWEFFVNPGTKPTWQELKDYCMN